MRTSALYTIHMTNQSPRLTHTRLILSDTDGALQAMQQAATQLDGYNVEPLPSDTPAETAATLTKYHDYWTGIVSKTLRRPYESQVDPEAATKHAKSVLDAGGHLVKLVIQTTPDRPNIDSKPFFDLVEQLKNKDSK